MVNKFCFFLRLFQRFQNRSIFFFFFFFRMMVVFWRMVSSSRFDWIEMNWFLLFWSLWSRLDRCWKWTSVRHTSILEAIQHIWIFIERGHFGVRFLFFVWLDSRSLVNKFHSKREIRIDVLLGHASWRKKFAFDFVKLFYLRCLRRLFFDNRDIFLFFDHFIWDHSNFWFWNFNDCLFFLFFFRQRRNWRNFFGDFDSIGKISIRRRRLFCEDFFFFVSKQRFSITQRPPYFE